MATYDSGGVPVADQAKAWVDAVNSGTGPSGGWRLQFIRMRTRRHFGKPLCGDDPSTVPPPDPSVTDANGEPVASVRSDPGECPEAPVRIRRFVSGCPWALVDQAVRYLHRIAPYRGIVYNGVRLDGAYRPTVTQWVRDEQSQSPGERGSLGTYTLIQDLVEITCCGDKETLWTGSSCQSTEETTYVWDADSVEPLPVSCEQGVTYSLRAVQRDEDGNFSYQLVKTVARTVAWGPVDVSCQGLEKVVEWGWRNLYGDPDSGFESHGCGEAPPYAGVDVPKCSSTPAPGVRIESQWQMNPDCTWDVRVRKRTAEPGTGEWDDGMSCRPSHHVVYRNSLDVPAVAPPAVGERVSAGFRLNDDLTWDGEEARTEAPPPESWSWVDGSACRRRRTTVLDDWRSRPDVPAVGEGETLDASLSRNEDCTWNARFSVTEAPDPDHMQWEEGSECQPTTSHRYVNQKSYEGLIPPPARGQRVNGDVNRNPDCTYDVRYSVTDAYNGDDVTWDDGTGCQVRHHTLWIDRAEKPVVGPAAPGETVSASLRFDPSSCTWSGEKVVTEAARADHMQWEEGSECQPTTSHRYVSQPSYEGLIPPPARGQRVNGDVNRNPDCTYDVRYSVTDAYNGDDVTWDDGTECQARHHTLWIDRREKPEIGTVGKGQTVSASLRFDPASCTWSGERVVADPMPPDTMEWQEGSCLRPTTTVHGVSQTAKPTIPAPGEGRSVSASVHRNSDCTYDYQYSTSTAVPKTTGWITWDSETKTERGVMKYHHGYYGFFNQTAVPRPTRGSNVHISSRLNEFCLFDGEMTYSDLYAWTSGGGGESGSRSRTRFSYVGTDSANSDKTRKPVIRSVLWKVTEIRVFKGEGTEASMVEFILDGGVPAGSANGWVVLRKVTDLSVDVHQNGGRPNLPGAVIESDIPKDVETEIQQLVGGQ